MRSKIRRRLTAKAIFILGLFLMLSGIAFLLGSMADTSKISVLSAFLFVIIGALCAVFAIKLNRRSLYLFLAAYFILVGFFLLVSAIKIIPFHFSQMWPLLSVFAGLALIPAGWHRYGSFRSKYTVPAGAFVGLGCVLMFFSFKVVPFSFSRFMLNWWPLLIALAGLILVLIALASKHNGEEDSKG